MREGDNVLGRGGGRQRQPQHCQDAKCQTKLCGAIGLFHGFPSSLLSYMVAEPLIHMSLCPDKPILAGVWKVLPHPLSPLLRGALPTPQPADPPSHLPASSLPVLPRWTSGPWSFAS